MRFKCLYVLFIIATTLYANTQLISFVTPRHIFTGILFLFCMCEEKKLYSDKYFNLYLVFVFFFGLSSLLTGYFSSFFNHLLSFTLVAYVSYWSTIVLLKKYNALSIILYTILALGFFDAVVSIGQFLYIPQITSLPDIMYIHIDSEYIENSTSMSDLLGLTVPGIMVNDVYNGYFLGVASIFSLYLFRKGISLTGIVILGVILIGGFVTQERTPFYCSILVSVYVLFRILNSVKSNIKYVLSFVFVIVIIYGSSTLFEYLSSSDSRFALGMNTTQRDIIYQNALAFIEDNWAFGGFYYLLNTEHFAPHNILLNAWIYGGVFGLISITILLYRQIKTTIIQSIIKFQFVDYGVVICSLSYLAFTANSIMHNKSIVTGDALIWILWGAAFYGNHNSNKVVFE